MGCMVPSNLLAVRAGGVVVAPRPKGPPKGQIEAPLRVTKRGWLFGFPHGANVCAVNWFDRTGPIKRI